MTRDRRLGRGLEALLGKVGEQSETSESPDAADVTLADRTPRMRLDGPHTSRPVSEQLAPTPTSEPGPLRVAIGQISANPYQPRQDFDESDLATLAESLADHGLLQPVVVRRDGDRYQLVAGERRLRAAKMAGWNEVPIHLAEADDRQMAELAIVENMQRKDLNPLEKAASFSSYIKAYGITQEELASRLKIDRSTVANLIRLLELPEAVQTVLRHSKITQGHARALLPLGDEREQIAFSERIQSEKLSVRETEAAVQETIAAADVEPLSIVGRDGKTSQAGPANEHTAALEQEFRAVLGTKTKLTHNARGRGKLVIHFSNHEEFERIRSHICDLPESSKKATAG